MWGLPACRDVSAGQGHSLVLSRAGAVFAFGRGSEGQVPLSSPPGPPCSAADAARPGPGSPVPRLSLSLRRTHVHAHARVDAALTRAALGSKAAPSRRFPADPAPAPAPARRTHLYTHEGTHARL